MQRSEQSEERIKQIKASQSEVFLVAETFPLLIFPLLRA